MKEKTVIDTELPNRQILLIIHGVPCFSVFLRPTVFPEAGVRIVVRE